MNITPLPLKGACIIETKPFQDHRGKFARVFCRSEMEAILDGKIVEQINYSFTEKKGILRGLHYQCPPNAEIKMIRCLHGTAFDVIVDIRKGSPTFLKWHGEILSKDNMKMILVPEGFAHGYQTLENNCEIIYFNTAPYNPALEKGIRYNDPMINIKWPLKVTDISEKDSNHPLLTPAFSGILP